MVKFSMNIFVLDREITNCARYHCDQHVVKMILESAQMLCTALHKKGFTTPYRPTHKNHPCVLWVEKSYANFTWLVELAQALNREYRFRFDRNEDHKSIGVIQQICNYRYAGREMTPFVQVMPEKYQVPGDTVTAYRNYYRGEKLAFAAWRRRPRPEWLSRLEKIDA